ncbi:MAG: tRNA epoxyqueuosine(34) reductase QueG [Moraxellaceae bacterium]|nr:tRNA epoxyqueuosine(34) reductase QueG [Pseudobdellovibrionaceae bacterium]
MLAEIQTELINQLGLDQVTLIPLGQPISISFYNKWLAENYYGSMNYLKEHAQMKADPRKINPDFQSVITVTQTYFPTVDPTSVKLPARTALYAQNSDYHFWLKEKLNQIISQFQTKYPSEIFSPYVDSGPILEKDIAYRAGHGWFGKNSCLIHPQKGSLFFIAEILTSLKVEPLKAIEINPLPDMCGTCTRCMDICPTQAIIEPKIIKADQCISYLTIESKTIPPVELRSKMNDWFFGCDLCQTVCPWNEKVFRIQKIPASNLTSTEPLLSQDPREHTEMVDFFKMILTSSNKSLQKHFTGTALHRAGGFGLKRNALVVIANRKISELRIEVHSLLNDPKLSELAGWTLENLK